MKNTLSRCLAGVLGVGLLASSATAAPSDLPEYDKVAGISGPLNSIGSDTLNNLMALWAEKFRQIYPGVMIQVEGKGSSTAPPALIEGTAQLAPMSREMKSSELDKFEAKFGYKPTEVKVAVDALAVFVNKDNPVKSLTLGQIDGIFSETRLSGAKNITTWGQIGLPAPYASQPISIYGRNSASGTYGFFKEVAIGKGDFKNSVKEQPGSSSVVQSISVDKFAIGYSGIGYKTAGVKAVAVAESESSKAFEATADNAYAGDYPLSRFLYIYVNKAPGKAVDPLVKEFLTYVLSEGGQESVEKDGYFSIPASIAKDELTKLQ